jgi:hypothetical protein
MAENAPQTASTKSKGKPGKKRAREDSVGDEDEEENQGLATARA